MLAPVIAGVLSLLAGPEARRQTPISAKCECEGLHAGIEKLDLERMVADLAGLAHELVEPPLRDDAQTFGVGIRAVALARRLSVDRHAEVDRRAAGSRAEDEMQIAGVKAVGDASALFVENRAPAADRPIARHAPFVEARRLELVEVASVRHSAAVRDEILGPEIAD